MRSASTLFGSYRPGTSPWHRLGVGWKYLVVLTLTLVALVWQQPEVTAVSLLVTLACLATTRLPARVTLAVPWSLVVLLVVLAAFQLLVGQPAAAFVVAGNVLVAVLAARLIVCTTPASVLIDALVRGADRLPFVDGERLGLTVGIMLRSIPFLTGAFYDVRDAARARGLERHWLARLSPVVVRAVGFAQATGDALAARGLGEGSRHRPH
ncbi:energy-coupling factor transporter transmembrane component T family protein [Micropruina sp.]|uniref:energy-coupling factor transporter transmembrane component T family protein n=1 Tax=Micropruina sp. TaxID=2737536 RepID=UPI0039E31F37